MAKLVVAVENRVRKDFLPLLPSHFRKIPSTIKTEYTYYEGTGRTEQIQKYLRYLAEDLRGTNIGLKIHKTLVRRGRLSDYRISVYRKLVNGQAAYAGDKMKYYGV